MATAPRAWLLALVVQETPAGKRRHRPRAVGAAWPRPGRRRRAAPAAGGSRCPKLTVVFLACPGGAAPAIGLCWPVRLCCSRREHPYHLHLGAPLRIAEPSSGPRHEPGHVISLQPAWGYFTNRLLLGTVVPHHHDVVVGAVMAADHSPKLELVMPDAAGQVGLIRLDPEVRVRRGLPRLTFREVIT